MNTYPKWCRRLTVALIVGIGGIVVYPSAEANNTPPGEAAISSVWGEVPAPAILPAPGTTGSIVVVKQTTDGEPVPGANFVARQVLALDGEPVDLTVNAGWQLLEAAGIWAPDMAAAQNRDLAAGAVAQVQERASFSSAVQAQTDAQGQATFAGLPVGLYLVTEPSSSPTGTGSEPILITLPHPDVSTSAWVNDAVATPKPALPASPAPQVSETPLPSAPSAPTADPVRPGAPGATRGITSAVADSQPVGTHSRLWRTGLQVGGSLIAAAALIAGGIMLSRRSRKAAPTFR